MYKILLIDDDSAFLESLSKLLSIKYEVVKTTSPQKGISLCGENKFDLIIVDFCMDEMTGVVFTELVQDLFPPQKIIILSGTDNLDDKLNILDKDVVDYIDKAVEPEVLMKKVERILSTKQATDRLYSKKENIVLDKSNRFVYINDKKTTLSNKEFYLLANFLENKNQIMKRDEIYERVWGDVLHTTNLRVVDIYVLRLRKKLDLKCVHSERGVGYIWEE